MARFTSHDSAGASPTSPSPEHVVAAALSAFASDGYTGTKLEQVAKNSGMSKRMIHYHFGSKKELYVEALHLALSQFAPSQEVLQHNAATPIDGIRIFAESLFSAFLAHPDAARLVIRENVDPVLDAGEAALLPGANEVTLHVERLVLSGQETGVFRPGVSAVDVLIVITSLCFFRVGSGVTALHVGYVDVTDERTICGLRRLVVDTVLALLTSNLPSSGFESYVSSAALPVPEDLVPTSNFSDVYEHSGKMV